MIMINESVWPVAVAAIAATLIGYAWYHPRLFGALWMRLHGTTPAMAEHGAKRARLYTVLGFVSCVVVAYIMRALMIGLGIMDIVSAVRLGSYMWLGFAVPILLGSVLWEHRPLKLYLINIGYWLCALIVMAVILVL